MTGYYAQNPHYAPTDLTEDVERLERAEAEASRWFNDLTVQQKAIRDETLAAIAPYKGTPRWDREKAAADFIWERTTIDAKRVCEMVLRDLMTLGEISEATSYAFDEVKVGQVMQAAE